MEENDTLKENRQFSPQDQAILSCRCGCIPNGLLSLHQMAEKRKEYLQRKKSEKHDN
jgi:hypothetical protein